MPRKNNSGYYLVVVIVMVFFVACDSKAVYDQYKNLPKKMWHKDSLVIFTVEPPDTIYNYNLFINLRNTQSYKYSNLFLVTELSFPNGKTVTDTLEYKMAKPNGEFLGEGFSDIKENKLWYKGYNTPFTFNESGHYTFKVQHAMRKNGDVNGIIELEGITDVGFRVEKY